jgi:hypothetical protein
MVPHYLYVSSSHDLASCGWTPAVEYRVLGYRRVSLSASFVECKEVPVTMIFVTPAWKNSGKLFHGFRALRAPLFFPIICCFFTRKMTKKVKRGVTGSRDGSGGDSTNEGGKNMEKRTECRKWRK